MSTIVINTDDLREHARRLRGAIDRLDQLDHKLRVRLQHDHLLAKLDTDVRNSLVSINELRNMLAQDHNEVVREVTEVEADEGQDPGGSFVPGTAPSDTVGKSTGDKSPFQAFIDLVVSTYGTGIALRMAWVTAEGSVAAGTQTIPVPGFGSAWDEDLARATREELRRARASSNRDSAAVSEETNRKTGKGTGDDPGDQGHGQSRSGKGGDGTGRAKQRGGSGSNGDAPGGRDESTPGGGDAAGERDGGRRSDGPAGKGKESGGATGRPSSSGTGEGEGGESSESSDTGGGEKKGEGGKGSGGGGFGGGSIGDFFKSIIENPISAVLAALPLLSNPVGWAGAVALLAMAADDLIAGISELINDPEAFVAAVGDFMEDSLEDLVNAAEDFITEPAGVIGDTLSGIVEGVTNEIEDYLENFANDPLGTIVDSVAEAAKLAGVDLGDLAGDALGAIGELSPEVFEAFDDIAELASDAGALVDDALAAVDTVTDVLKGVETARGLLETVGLGDIASAIPSIEDAIDLVPGAKDVLQTVGVDPSDLVHGMNLSDLPGELNNLIGDAIDSLPLGDLGDLPKSIAQQVANAFNDLPLSELTALPPEVTDALVNIVGGLAINDLGSLPSHLAASLNEAIGNLGVEDLVGLADSIDVPDPLRVALGSLPLNDLASLGELPDALRHQVEDLVRNLPISDLPDGVGEIARSAVSLATIGDLPVGVRDSMNAVLSDVTLGELPESVRHALDQATSTLPLDRLAEFSDHLRDRIGGVIADVAGSDPEAFARQVAEQIVAAAPPLPQPSDLLRNIAIPADILDAFDEVKGIRDCSGVGSIFDEISRPLHGVDLPQLPDQHDLLDRLERMSQFDPEDRIAPSDLSRERKPIDLKDLP